jgi:hypothetical protein
MLLRGEVGSGGGAAEGVGSEAPAGSRRGALAFRVCCPEPEALDRAERGRAGGLTGLAFRAFSVDACFSPSRRGLRTPGRALGRFPKTPRSRDGGSGVSGSEFIAGCRSVFH